MRVFYLVSPSVAVGISDAMSRGWRQVARGRFATGKNDDVRLITRFRELVPNEKMGLPGPTQMFRGLGYEDGEGCFSLDRWIDDKGRFDEFVASGAGVWME